MKRLTYCVHKGGHTCRNHGGSGAVYHETDYVHPFPCPSEMNKSYQPLTQDQIFSSMGERNIELAGLDTEFDDDSAVSMLGITFNKSLTKAVTEKDFLQKSFFDFDLVTEKGLVKLLNLLPVLDFEIMKDVVESIWPAYPTEGLNPATVRVELRGFILDYLDEINQGEAISGGSEDSL